MVKPYDGDDENEVEAEIVELPPIELLSKEIREMGKLLDREQARGLVDLYYRLQEERKRVNSQIRAAKQGKDPGTMTLILDHYAAQFVTMESEMPKLLGVWANQYRVGQWAMAQKGIGPILSAGLLAHIDITKAATAGAIWRFAGYDPTVRWEKGQKRPFNADLKTLCWKISDSFVKVSGREGAVYGKLYRERKEYEVERNESGGNAEAARIKLETQQIKSAELREVLETGKLADGQIDLRARRWVSKIFLSHWHHVAYEAHYGTPPPAPFAIAQLGHAHFIPIPPG